MQFAQLVNLDIILIKQPHYVFLALYQIVKIAMLTQQYAIHANPHIDYGRVKYLMLFH